VPSDSRNNRTICGHPSSDVDLRLAGSGTAPVEEQIKEALCHLVLEPTIGILSKLEGHSHDETPRSLSLRIATEVSPELRAVVGDLEMG
jgi:hypothetical protein